MSVVIKDNTDSLIAKFNNQADLAVELAGRDLARKGSLKAPKDKGFLAQRVRQRKTAQGEYTVQWQMPYAAYQERGSRRDGTRVVRRYTKPGTGSRFARTAAEEVNGDFTGYLRKAGL